MPWQSSQGRRRTSRSSLATPPSFRRASPGNPTYLPRHPSSLHGGQSRDRAREGPSVAGPLQAHFKRSSVTFLLTSLRSRLHALSVQPQPFKFLLSGSLRMPPWPAST
eukprot:13136959-Alexandrium_andersonii.AAC.1